MSKLDVKKLAETIKLQIKNYKENIKLENIGQVISIADGIVLASGLEKAMLGELVLFTGNTKGMVIDLATDMVGIILLSNDNNICAGDKVKLTGQVFTIPVGHDLLGRVINPLGEPLDGNGVIKTTANMPVERPAYSVCERGSVNTPLETGIMMIDSLIPIGRGQRELIIGDRKTGKTTIAIDTIINQKGKNVKCIYCAIGQKEASVATTRRLLQEYGAMEYTTIVVAGASAPAPLLYLAPFAAVSMAEYFMQKGDDVLVIYDDLTKHAQSYREISLLLKRPPGREAFPGDIFYLHSRLLERAAKLSSALGGGSITALPIIETQAGDISQYIPTNVISITDGQIFLESELFYAGIRPAINSGLSVSRVGGSAQIKAIKQVAGTLRINLASFRELESFAQFGSDLDQSSLNKLNRGRRAVEILKQNVHELKDIVFQVVILYALNNQFLDELAVEQINSFSHFIMEKIRLSSDGQAIANYILQKKVLPQEQLLKQFLEDNLAYFKQ